MTPICRHMPESIGAEVLKSVSELVRTMVTEFGIAARHGGEEILMALRDTGLDRARELSQWLCEGVRNLDLSTLGLGVGRVTASFGVATLADHGPTSESVLRCADQAMYAAKAGG